jgi:hypothetical protein
MDLIAMLHTSKMPKVCLSSSLREDSLDSLNMRTCYVSIGVWFEGHDIVTWDRFGISHFGGQLLDRKDAFESSLLPEESLLFVYMRLQSISFTAERVQFSAAPQ